MAVPYGLTATDLHERLSPERIADITDNDDQKVEQAALDTAAEIELFAGRYYAVPLAPFTGGLRTLFLDLWRWRLIFNCKPLWLNTDDKASDEYAIAQNRRRIEAWLAGLSSDERTIVLPGVAERSTDIAPSGAWSAGGGTRMSRKALSAI